VVPAAAAIVALAVGELDHPATALRPLAAPIGFLLVAVPLAALLDDIGFFDAASAAFARGTHLVLGLWVLGAVVTTTLNLDAAVVLLTPLYVRIARRRGLDPLALAFQPVLLSCLASSALPVSNLTNLIAASAVHLDARDFLAHLALPSLVATVVGWFAYTWACRPGVPSSSADEPVARRPLVIGSVVVAAVVVGFVAGSAFGVPEWTVALVADVVLVAMTRRVPLRFVPWDTAVVAASLGVLAIGAASHVDLSSWFGGTGNVAFVRVAALGAVAANVVNNLPALLVALPHASGDNVWALLLGVNIGPLVLVTGSLAALLWQATLARLDVHVGAADFARVGTRVVLPSLLAAVATSLVLANVGAM